MTRDLLILIEYMEDAVEEIKLKKDYNVAKMKTLKAKSDKDIHLIKMIKEHRETRELAMRLDDIVKTLV